MLGELHQQAFTGTTSNQVPPLQDAEPPSTGGDTVGSFGPSQAYTLPGEGFVVDVTDCVEASAAFSPGTQMGGPKSKSKKSYTCTVTARGRLSVASGTQSWSYDGQTYTQQTFASAHESRAIIVTPE